MKADQAGISAARRGLSPALITMLIATVTTTGVALLPVHFGKDPNPIALLIAAIVTIAFFSLLFKHRARRWWIGAMAGAGVALVILAVLPFLSSHNTYDELSLGLALGAANSNRAGPRQIDDVTRLDKAIAGPGHKITYQMTITSVTSTKLPHDFVAKLEARVKSNACNGELKVAFANRVVVVYEYHANDGPQIAKFELTSALCEHKPG